LIIIGCILTYNTPHGDEVAHNGCDDHQAEHHSVQDGDQAEHHSVQDGDQQVHDGGNKENLLNIV
jgi:hypothetical protein